MTYETYQIPEKYIKTLQKAKAAKLTLQYINEHGEEPPANVKAGFMDISEKEYEKYRKIFFAVDFSKGIDGDEAIIDYPDIRPTKRYDEYFQCVYNVVDTTNKTKVFGDSGSTSDITYVEIDGNEVPVSEISRGEYLFNSIGTHRIDFLKKDAYKIATVNFKNCQQLREITIPEIVQMTQTNVGNYIFQNCKGLYKITFLSKTPPQVYLGTQMGGNDVSGIKSTGTIYVPKGCKEAYENMWITQTNNSTTVEVLGSGWKVIEMDD